MTAVTLNPAGGLSPAAANVSATNTGNKEKSTDFGTLMLGKLENKADTGMKQTEVTFKDGTKTTISTPVKKNDFATKTPTDNVADKVSEKKTTASKDDKRNINAEEAAAAIGVMSNIIEGIAKILNISEEELGASMDALGMSPEDLLEQNSLAELVLMQNGSSDMTDMLVDNGMLETFNELRDFIATTLAEEGLDANSFADMLASKQFKDMAADILKDDEGNILTEYYENASAEVATTEMVGDMEDLGEETGLERNTSTENDRTEINNEGRIEINPEAFINNLENAANVDEMAAAEQAQFREIAFQVVEQVKVNLSPDTTSMEMQLNPENLGRVAINVSSKAGIMTAEISTENEQAKEAIESQLQILKETIEARGLRVEAIEVKVSDFSFADSKNAESNADQYNGEQNERHPRRGNNSIGGVTEETTDAAQVAREILANAGSTVNYRA